MAAYHDQNADPALPKVHIQWPMQRQTIQHGWSFCMPPGLILDSKKKKTIFFFFLQVWAGNEASLI